MNKAQFIEELQRLNNAAKAKEEERLHHIEEMEKMGYDMSEYKNPEKIGGATHEEVEAAKKEALMQDRTVKKGEDLIMNREIADEQERQENKKKPDVTATAIPAPADTALLARNRIFKEGNMYPRLVIDINKLKSNLDAVAHITKDQGRLQPYDSHQRTLCRQGNGTHGGAASGSRLCGRFKDKEHQDLR